ncbi:MAG TPA: nuclear transport factor 2 family protein [Gammaproteobacteria bacterium]
MHKSVFHVSAAVCGCLVALTPLRDKAMAQQVTTLAAMDYIEIQQLVNKLNFALDYCINGGQDFADLFIEGGQYIIDTGDGMPTVRSTREELIALASGPDCEARKTPPSSYILHLAESLVIEATAGGARGKSYAIYPSNKGKYLSEDVAGQLGIYHDEYVRAADGWRLRSRRHEINPTIGGVEL